MLTFVKAGWWHMVVSYTLSVLFCVFEIVILFFLKVGLGWLDGSVG